MLDTHLAELYGVLAKRLNEQVRRNLDRFPSDFMFQLTWEEVEPLRSQIATLDEGATGFSKRGRHRKYPPYAFTEQGVAMLSGILRSKRAVQVNVAIMRVFVKLREILLQNKELAQKLSELEQKIEKHDEDISAIFEAIRRMMAVEEKPKRQIGFYAR